MIELSANAFWLLPPVWFALIIFRYYRSKRQELLAGSLLLWRRLAAQQPKAPPKRFRLDRSFILQALALAGLIAAFAAPRLVLGDTRGRTILLVVDNGPLSRANAGGKQLWEHVRSNAEQTLKSLNSNDRVLLARSAPLPRVLLDSPATPAAALSALNEIRPALSGPDAAELWSYTVDQARSRGQNESALPALLISLQSAPAENPAWQCASPQKETLENVAIVAFGSAPMGSDSGQAGRLIHNVEILARVRNCGEKSASGILKVETAAGGGAAQERKLALSAHSEEAVIFTLSENLDRPIRISWHSDAGPDALPDDDVVIATPHPIRPPRVRFHAEIPALENLYRKALDAVMLKPDENGPADIDIYAGAVPDSLPDTRGLLLLAPSSGYRSFFEVGPKILDWPQVERGDPDGLSEGITNIPVPKAAELIATGNLRVLLKAPLPPALSPERRGGEAERIIAARFSDERERVGYVFAFVPGAGYPPERPLEPSLAAMLVRIALQAANAGEPYVVAHAEELERKGNEPLPPNWFDSPKPEHGIGVLNEKTSTLVLPDPGVGSGARALPAFTSTHSSEGIDLAPWLIAVALALLATELWLEYGGLQRIHK